MKRKLSDLEQEEIFTFFEAIDNNELKVIEKMLSEKPDLINEKNYSGNGALSYALSRKRNAIAKYLIKHGADVNSLSSRGNSILQQVLKSRTNNLVIAILERNDLVIDESYDINNAVLSNSPELLAKTISMMILKSCKPLETLLSPQSCEEVNSSSRFTKSLSKLLGNTEQVYDTEQNSTEIVDIIQQSIDSYAEVRDPLVSSVRAQGYELQEVSRDGNCLFTAVAVSIYKNLNSENLSILATDFRKQATEYMINNLDNFIDYFEDREDFYWYIERLNIEGEEADHVAIQALSDATEREFIIHQGDMISIIHPRREGSNNLESHIFYDGRHFDGLIREHNDRRLEYHLVENFSIEVNDPDIEYALNILFENDVIEEYENSLSEEWFLNSLETMIDHWLGQYNVIGQNDNYMIMTGMTALYFFMPHKFEGHI